MSMEFKEVTEAEFARIGGEPPEHRKIEAALVNIGGKGVHGNNFKHEALKAAGWTYGKMTSYGAKPEAAARAFNRLRAVLRQADEKTAVLAALVNANE